MADRVDKGSNKSGGKAGGARPARVARTPSIRKYPDTKTAGARVARPGRVDFGSLSQAQLGEVFGCTRQAVGKWKCPKNRNGKYDLRRVVLWWGRRERDDERALALKDHTVDLWQAARGRLKQIELQKEEGQILDREDVLKQTVTAVTAMKARLLQAPLQAAPRAAMQPEHVVLRIFEDAVHEALQELSEALTS